MKKIVIIFLMLSNITFAQHYYNFLTPDISSFENEPPTKVNQINNEYITPVSPFPFICDSSGKIRLFQTNQFFFATMDENGGLSNPIGTSSVSGAVYPIKRCVLIPAPNKSNIILSFFSDHLALVSGESFYGLQSYVIDKEKNNGMGQVLNPNANQILKKPSHGIHVIKHRNGIDYWLITQSADTVFSILIDSSLTFLNKKKNIDNNKLFSFHNNVNYSANTCITSNIIGNKLIIVCLEIDTGIIASKVTLYDFDNESGEINNPKIITNSLVKNDEDYNYFDACFSPNDSLLYVTSISDSKVRIEQYDIYFEESKPITIAEYPFNYSFSINRRFRGPGVSIFNNRKIYFTFLSNKIGHITYPDKRGLLCQPDTNVCFTSNCYHSSNIIGQSFPFMLHDGFVHFSAEVNCKQVVLRNISDSIFSMYQWYFGDGDSLLSNNAVVSHTYTQPGKYLVKLKGTRPSGYVQWYSDSIDIGPDVLAGFTSNTAQACRYTQVQFMDTSVTAYHNPLIGPSYFWNFGDGTTDTLKNPKHSYTQTGLFNITLVYSNGYCTDTLIRSQAIDVIDAAKPGINAPNDKLCAPTNVSIQLQYNSNIIDSVFYQSSTGWDTAYKYTSNTPLAIFFADSGSYFIRQQLKSTNGCLTTDSALVTVYPGFNLSTSPVMHSINVTGHDSILLQWYTLKGAIAYELLRNNGTLSTLSDTFFLDRAAASNTIYAYNIRATDVCNQKSNLSPVSSNLLLRAVPDNSGKVQLSWNTYVYWNSGVENYSVQYQRPDSFVDISFINTLAFEDSSLYSDTLIDIAKCYRVTAHQNNSTASAKSNLVCIPFIPQLWIPDAFSPNPTKDQLNNCWSIENVGVEEFYLEIYNRWGERIFKTEDKNFCWDGNYQNKPSPDGVYFYIVRAKGKARLAFEKKGMIYLTR